MVRNPNVAYIKDGSDQGDELSMVLRPIPAESPHLKGRIEKAIDFFKDMFVKLNAQFQFNQRNDPQEYRYLFRLQQSHQEERFHAIPICHWKVTADPNVSC